MKKLLALAVVGGIAFWVYRQFFAPIEDEDVWTQATVNPDLR